MSFIDKYLTDTITLWTQGGLDNFGMPGSWTSSEIEGRWEEKQSLVKDANGEQVVSSAKVFLKQDVSEGDYLFHGSDASSAPPNTSSKVIAFAKTPSIGNDSYERIAFLE